MKLKLYKSLWGLVRADGGTLTLKQAIGKLVKQEYAGVECSVKLAHKLNKRGQFTGLLQDHGLDWVPIVYSSGPVNGWDPFVPHPDRSPEYRPYTHKGETASHVQALQTQIADAQLIAGEQIPIPFFNAHSGHDSFDHSRFVQLLEACHALEAQLDISMVHEIHRGRMCYSPWVVSRLVRDVPVKLVADYSHFMCVAEASPDDELLNAAISDLIPHVHHIHGRIGYENGPQVNDPRGPEWVEHSRAYMGWWLDIWRHQHEVRGAAEATFTPEFGPPPYQQTLPKDSAGFVKPLASIHLVNNWMAKEAARGFMHVGEVPTRYRC